MFNYQKIKSPVGALYLVSTGRALAAVVFESGWPAFLENQKWELSPGSDPVIKKTEAQLLEYFAGKRTEFDIPLYFSGTDFQNLAWKSLMTIPYGETASYSDQAKRLKKPEAVRAVGAANGKNKICIIVPCHRVIGKNGSLTGFSGGIEIKKQLLKLESALSAL